MAWGDRAAAHPDSILKCEIEEVTLSRQNIFIEYLIFFYIKTLLPSARNTAYQLYPQRNDSIFDPNGTARPYSHPTQP